MVEYTLVDEAGEAVGVEIPAQGFLVVVLGDPVEEGFAALALAGIGEEEGIEDAGARSPDVAEANGELAEGLAGGTALEQDEQAGREPRAVGSGLAVNQAGLLHRAVDFMKAKDAVALWGAAAFHRHVDEIEAEAGGGLPGESVSAIIGLAAEVDQGPDTPAAGEHGEAAGRGMVGPIEAAGRDLGEVGKAEAEDGVVDEEGVDPGDEAPARGGQIAAEDGVHLLSGSPR